MNLSANSSDGQGGPVEALGAGTVATQLEGERIARDVADRVRADRVLGERSTSFYTPWQWFIQAAGIAAFVWLLAPYDSFRAAVLMATTTVALFVALASFGEIFALRRRLHAAVVLLRAHDEQLNR